MSRTLLLLLLLSSSVVLADDAPEAEPSAEAAEEQAQAQEGAADVEPAAAATKAETPTKEGAKLISGMSILGNQEAPKSLVIVPWKGSLLGDPVGISTMLDDSRNPVDREVFMRALNFYEIRSGATP